MRVFVGRKFPKEVIQRLQVFRSGEIEWIFAEDEKFSGIEHADIVYTYKLNESQVCAAQSLKWVQTSSVGIEHLPLELLKVRSIQVTNVSGVGERMVAQYVVSSMLYLTRQMGVHYRNQLEHTWIRIPGNNLKDKKVLFLGTGKISMEAARLLSMFEMDIFGFNRSGECPMHFKKIFSIHDIHNSLPEMDFVVNALPETRETRGIFGRREIELMKPSVYLIQVGRAGVMNEEALYTALAEKRIAGAVLDVFWDEPLTKDSPWYKLDNILITPHIAGISHDYDEKISDIFLNNLERFISGKTLINRVI